MDVHHHSHTARKKWTHYFWEFLMLFLAVFCGFMAEYQLEHKIEKERGKQYIHSFREDLRKDTAQCNRQINELSEKESALQSMDSCFARLLSKSEYGNCLNEVVNNTLGFYDFIYTDRTIQQLKYSGGLRLIQNRAIADSIIGYDAEVRELHIHQEVLENYQLLAHNAHNKMLEYNFQVRLNEGKKLALTSSDPREMHEYFNVIYDFRRGCLTQLRRLKDIREKATRLLQYLEEKGYRD